MAQRHVGILPTKGRASHHEVQVRQQPGMPSDCRTGSDLGLRALARTRCRHVEIIRTTRLWQLPRVWRRPSSHAPPWGPTALATVGFARARIRGGLPQVKVRPRASTRIGIEQIDSDCRNFVLLRSRARGGAAGRSSLQPRGDDHEVAVTQTAPEPGDRRSNERRCNRCERSNLQMPRGTPPLCCSDGLVESFRADASVSTVRY